MLQSQRSGIRSTRGFPLVRFSGFLFLVLFASEARAQSESWPQWGGPQRNFITDTRGLADTWPPGGPKQLWSRELGEGHSSIVADDQRLYTMYSRGSQEFVVAIDRTTGKTVWEKSYAAATQGLNLQVERMNVRGPHSTPLIVGDVLVTAGIIGRLQVFEKSTGNLVWSHDLWTEFHGTRTERGYTCSPLAYKDTVIAVLGGPGQALISFNLRTGAVVWKKQSFRLSFSSPILINVDGQDQIAMAFGDDIVGLDPNNGDLLWRHRHPCEGFSITPPVWGADHILVISSAYDCGSRALELHQSDGKTTVRELWTTSRMRVHHGTIIRIGDLLIGSSGTSGPAPLTAVNVKTGEIVWQSRGFPKSNLIYADGKVILLDEDGQLALIRLSAQGMSVVSKTTVLENLAWTPPSLVGTNLYLRDFKKIVALDLK